MQKSLLQVKLDKEIIFLCNLTPLLSHPLHLPPYLFRGGNEKVTILSYRESQRDENDKIISNTIFFLGISVEHFINDESWHYQVSFLHFIRPIDPCFLDCNVVTKIYSSSSQWRKQLTWLCIIVWEGPTQQLQHTGMVTTLTQVIWSERKVSRQN